MVVMLPILASGCVMLTPILSWSATIRKHKLHFVVVSWGLLMFAALIPVAIKNLPGIVPDYVMTQLATCDDSKDPAICNYANTLENLNVISDSFYGKCVSCPHVVGRVGLISHPDVIVATPVVQYQYQTVHSDILPLSPCLECPTSS